MNSGFKVIYEFWPFARITVKSKNINRWQSARFNVLLLQIYSDTIFCLTSCSNNCVFTLYYSSMNASMATILGVSHLFSEAKDKHVVWIIVSMSGFEILFDDGKWWLLVLICDGNYCFKFCTSKRTIIYVILGGCFQWHNWRSWIGRDATGLICWNWFGFLFQASITSFSAFSFFVLISSSFFISVNLICLSNFSSVCDANTLAFCFSSNNVSDLELIEDSDDLDELWDSELLLDFRDLEDMDDFGLLSFDLELRWVFIVFWFWWNIYQMVFQN